MMPGTIRSGCCVVPSEVAGVQRKKTSGPPKGLLPSSFNVEDLEEYFSKLFSLVDENGDGVLQPNELTNLLQLCGFDLSGAEIAEFVNAADTNHDGVIEYSEFVPVATKMLQSPAAKQSTTASSSSPLSLPASNLPSSSLPKVQPFDSCSCCKLTAVSRRRGLAGQT